MDKNDQIKIDTMMTISDDEELTVDKLNDYLNLHESLINQRYKKLYNAYIGDYPILHQQNKVEFKPDNRIIVNFAKYIVDVFNGFFIGVPIKVSSMDTSVDSYLNMLDKYNDQDDNNAELSKICSIYGKGYELYYVDEDKNISIVYMNPMEGFMIYDESVIQKPRYFVNYYTDKEGVKHGEIRDKYYIRSFDTEGQLTIGEEREHGFEDVPATEYIENEERMSIFEPCYSMINEYNKAISEKANDVDYFADAYLKVLGTKMNDEDAKFIKDNRIINFDGTDSDKIVVEFVDKPNADATQENLINRLERLIFQNSMVANINDENFGTSSGIALRYKLLSMSNLAKTKERKFTSGMNRRYRLIFSNPVKSMKNDDWMKVEYKFTQNYPANLLEEAQIAAQLSGIVSQETQLSIISAVENAQDEIKKMDQENDKTSYSTDYPTSRISMQLDESNTEEKDSSGGGFNNA